MLIILKNLVFLSKRVKPTTLKSFAAEGRKGKTILFGLAIFLAAFAGFGENQADFRFSSAHYIAYSNESESQARMVSQKMEAALKLYNDLFHYDLTELPARLNVKVFKEKREFDRYLEPLISETREDFVFISYSDPGRSELVAFKRTEEEFDASLVHYGFIQYFNAFIPNAPLWLEEGIAAYLEYSLYDPDADSFKWRANLVWLDNLKKILKNSDSKIVGILTIDKVTAYENLETFYPSAWGLVHFLMNGPDRRLNRIIWDSIAALDKSHSLPESSRVVKEKAFSWIKEEDLQKKFENYIYSLKNFNELVQEGIEHYSAKKLSEAEEGLKRALELRTDNHIPYYYLGLISYDRKEFQKADEYYRQALELGKDPGLIYYALGVNAFANKRYELAEKYLKQAREIDSDAYGDKADNLLNRIEFLK